MFNMSDKKKAKKERRKMAKKIGFGLTALGTAGLVFSLLAREKKVDKLSLDVAKRVLKSPKADSMYLVHALARVPDPPSYVGTFVLFPVGGGPDYDQREGNLAILQTGKTFSTKYKPLLLQTDNPKYVTWKNEHPLDKIPDELEKEFPGRKRFEVKKNTEPVYFCPKNLLASDNPNVLARRIANNEMAYDKVALASCASSVGVGLLLLFAF
ncbi:hypothetical protein A9K97_gp086 [Tokyovirus A1]|uniref:hypothetical protein n=1 Tax=Tokyovirus A1 TaxID=1826170 RepID=UPI0007A98909|nr:hypothetical protein A9K97_gp086 [Tokyovirus A1]BAU80265.1 conserved hypothetical protein [Tokyovirus A1]